MDEEHRVNDHWGVDQMSCGLHPPASALLAGHFLRCHPLTIQDKVRQSLEQQPQKQEKKAKPTRARPSVLDRFLR